MMVEQGGVIKKIPDITSENFLRPTWLTPPPPLRENFGGFSRVMISYILYKLAIDYESEPTQP